VERPKSMVKLQKWLSHARHFNWYLGRAAEVPICSDLDDYLPLPKLKHAKILWPNRYSWIVGTWKIDLLKTALSRFLPIETYNVEERCFGWHEKGGFPVPDGKLPLLGQPGHPKGLNDIRGEIFEVHSAESDVRCAFDYSDYPIVSTELLAHVDLYFKCVAPTGPLPSNVISIGYFPGHPGLLAKARKKILKRPPQKKFDVYGRFGSWTDSQPFRQAIVNNLRNSSLSYTGGFSVRIYPAYLKELMRARIALDVPGQAPLSYRLADAMALGAVVVCRKPACVFPEEMIDGVHYVAIQDDGSNVVEVCRELLKDEERRQRIVNEAMVFFDRNLSPQSMARRILRQAVGSA
jgi:glycosyltransferase involved in cell wall biosynthesis